MPRKNLLSLREAIVITLINHPTRTASFEDIATFIEERNLYPIRKGNIPLSTQVMLLSTKANGAYDYLFEEIGAGFIRLKDSYADFPLKLSEALDAVFDYYKLMFYPDPKPLNVVDIDFGTNNKIKISANKIICIIAKNLQGIPTGNKKFIYVKEDAIQDGATVKVYTTNGSLKTLQDKLDPLFYFLCPVTEYALVNVAHYNILKGKILKSIIIHPLITSMSEIKFSEAVAAKNYQKKFEHIQKQYNLRISLEKKILGYKGDFGL